ncbi:MAG: acetyl-CoA hydrolase/transferase family protein [Polyangiales bacterium]
MKKTAAEAVAMIQSGQRVFVHGVAAAPQHLLDALVARAGELRDVEIVHLHTEGPARYAAREYAKSFRVNALFVGENLREAVNEGRADHTPIFLSDIPDLFRSKAMPLDVALVQVSPPDRHGFCSLGTSVDVARAAVESAKHVIAQVNRHMPRTHGDGLLHVSALDVMVEHDAPLPEHKPHAATAVETAIGVRVAELVEDCSTLQMGIGGVPDAVLSALGGHKHLGVHTEMFSDGLVDLIERGVVTNTAKAVHPGKTVSAFVMGSKRVYDFVDDNPAVALLDAQYVNDPNVIRRNPRVVAINSAIEIDLTGLVCADSVGTRQISGVGGQMDFMRGAARSPGGKPIIALTSTTHHGSKSRIVPTLEVGAGVITTRAHVHWIVTEHGAVNLHGKSFAERAKALIALADPRHRDVLIAAARARFGIC